MIARIAGFVLMVWLIGFVWFAFSLPQAAPLREATDVIVVPTGGVGRIDRGVELLRRGAADKLLVKMLALEYHKLLASWLANL